MARVLELPAVNWVHFYTNAIAFDKKRRAQFMALPHFEKLSLNFSVGGLERESYRQLYGVDRFDRVRRNIHAVLEELKARGERTEVGIELRLLKWQTGVKVKDAVAVYNPMGYAHAGVNIRRSYDHIGGIIKPDVLELNESISKAHRPCQMLGDTRFAADGSVWVCGCTVSEQPGKQEELRIGRVNTPPEILAERRERLVRNWREHNIIPEACQGCSHYIQHRGWKPAQPPLFVQRGRIAG